MFDLGWSKVLILAVIAIVVVGPKDLPVLLKTIGRLVGELRRHAADFRAQFNEAMRETELDQIRQDIQSIKTDATAAVRDIGSTLERDLEETKRSVAGLEHDIAAPAPGEAAAPAASETATAASQPSLPALPEPAPAAATPLPAEAPAPVRTSA